MARLDSLWKSVDGPGTPPGLDKGRVKARVNAALDANQAERKIYMKQKLRMALIAAAAVAALTGSAFAATTGWTGLSSWFKETPTSIQDYVDSTVRSVSDENYTLTVEGMAASEDSAYLTATITALSDEAKEFLWDEHFISMDTLEVWVPAQEPDAPSGSLRPVGHGSRELEADADNSRRFALEVDALPYPVDALYVWCGYMEEGKRVKVPVTAAAPSVTVKLGASGSGVPGILSPISPDDDTLTVDEITLSPFTCRIKVQNGSDAEPNIRLRMEDGSVLTQSQLMTARSGIFNPLTNQRESSYRFKEIQDLDRIVSVIVFDMEYPLDGSKPTPVEHDPALDPITVTRMEALSEGAGFSIPVRELTEKLGGVCEWNPATGDVTCTYRDVSIVLRTGEDTALVDGKPVTMHMAPAEQDGALAADYRVFWDAWGIDGFVRREYIQNEKDPADKTIIWGDWYVIP